MRHKQKLQCISKRCLFVALLTLSAVNVRAGYFSRDVDGIFQLIYNYKLLSADTAIKNASKTAATDPVWSLLKANEAWTQIIAGNLEDEKWNKQFTESLNTTEKLLHKGKSPDHKTIFYRILVHAFRTRYDMLQGNYISAVTQLNACLDDIETSFGKEKEFEPFYLTSGLYYYFMANAYDEYILMRPVLLAFPKGDKVKGMAYLKRIAGNSDSFLKNEANYFLMRIYLDVEEKKESALSHANVLCALHPNNLIYRFYQIELLRDLGRDSDAARQVAMFKKQVQLNKQLTASQKKFFLDLVDE
jgi:hypothetical protein